MAGKIGRRAVARAVVGVSIACMGFVAGQARAACLDGFCANSTTTVTLASPGNALNCNVTGYGRNVEALDAGADPEAGYTQVNLQPQGVWGGDLGSIVYDGTRTYIYFGDTPTDHDAGNPYVWSGQADFLAWFPGKLSDPDGGTNLCTNLNVAMEGPTYNISPGLDAGLGVFSPDWVLPPTNWDLTNGIADFIYRKTVNKPSSPYFPYTDHDASPSQSEIPGLQETPSGVFADDAGNLYRFNVGAQCVPSYCSASTAPLPVPNVSYFTVPPNNVTGYPTKTVVASAVDFNTNYPDVTCDGGAGGTYMDASCKPTGSTAQHAPPGWPDGGYPYGASPTLPPLGGNFVRVTPVVGPDNYVYLFGTGIHRKSYVYLARFPIANVPTAESDASTAYLKDIQGFEIWRLPNDGGAAYWSGTPPSADAISHAAPLFTDDANGADIGELSVQYFGDLGMWFMMYTPTGTKKVVLRYTIDPIANNLSWSSTWTPLSSSIIDTAATGDKGTYCCDKTTGLCTGWQVLDCSTGAFYAPYMCCLPRYSTARVPRFIVSPPA